ncbi:MAG: hypothetical protein HOE64_17190 [Nitrospina sp.]|nr:hypothetical protein [Nitrospina sp.]
MSNDDNFGKRGRSERNWGTSGELDVRGYLDDTFGAVSEEAKEAERNRVRNMTTGGSEAGNSSGVSAAPGLPNVGGGGGYNTRTNTNTSVSEIDKPTHEFRKKVYDKAGNVMDREFEAYGGDRFADAATDTLTAQQQIRDAQGSGQGAYVAAGKTAAGAAGYAPEQIKSQSFLGGKGVDQYMNPHTSNVISGMQDNAMRTMQMQREALGSKAQMSGAGMGSRSALEKGAMQGEVMRNLNQQTGQMLNQSFQDASQQKRADMQMEQDRQRYNQGAGLSGQDVNLRGAGMQGQMADASRKAGYQDAQMLSQVGADIEGRDQNQKDWEYDQFQEERDWDKNNAMFGSNVLSGAPVGTTTTNSNPQYQNKKVDRFGRVISGAAAGWLSSGGNPWGAAAGAAGGMFS